MFRELIPELARDYHVIAPDYPGFGLSAMPSVDDFDYTPDKVFHWLNDSQRVMQWVDGVIENEKDRRIGIALEGQFFDLDVDYVLEVRSAGSHASRSVRRRASRGCGRSWACSCRPSCARPARRSCTRTSRG